MKKILGLVVGLLFTLPSFATDLDLCRNLFDGQIEQGGISHANGTLAPSSTKRLYSVNFIDIQPNTSYALSAVVTEKIKQGMIFFYDNNENFIGMGSNNWVNLPFSATSPANAYKARFVLTQSDEGTILTPSDAQNVQFEQGSTATEYSAFCPPIKVATKKYSDSKFNPVMTALNSAITTIKTVVTNTINQAAAVESLQNGKQTMPNASATNGTCPNYKQCLLVETSDGTPQWFVITDPFRDFVAPILATNTNGTTSTNDPGYQQVEYIEKRTGSVFIDTGFVLSSPDTSYNQDVQYNMEFEFTQNPASGACLFGAENSSEGGYSGLWYFISNSSASLFTGNSGNMTTVGFTAGNKYSITIKVKNHKVEAYVDGTRVFYGGYSGVLGNNPIYVLGLYDLEHDGPYYNTPTKYIKIYKFQIIENGVLVFDGIPVRNLANSRIGLYDTVSRGFFGDASGDSTGFYAGSNVTNDPDVPANPTWSVTWSNNGNGVAGIVYGEGVCNAVAGTYAVAATSANLSASGWSQSGGSCWCKTTGATVNQESTPVSSAPWVFIGTRGSAAGCANRCAGDCVDSVRANAAFRTAIFNTGS